MMISSSYLCWCTWLVIIIYYLFIQFINLLIARKATAIHSWPGAWSTCVLLIRCHQNKARRLALSACSLIAIWKKAKGESR
jgi:hypothetical protein